MSAKQSFKSAKMIVAGLIFISLFSCASNSRKADEQPPDMPKWIYHYDSGGKICGVGTSLPHIKGIAYQRVLAISRAIDEIARQMNVTVDTRLESYMSGDSNGASSALTTYSVQTTSGQKVSARIVDAWMNGGGGEFYVLMCVE